MGAIIAQLIAVLGPLLVEALKKWLESLLNRTAKSMPKNSTAGELVTAALAATPRRQVFRRALLSRIAEHADSIAAGGKLNSAAKDEIRTLAGLAG